MAYDTTVPFTAGDATTVPRLNRGFENAKALLDGDAVIPGGEWFDVAHSAGHFTGSGSMTWGVDAGDQTYRRWKLLGGKTLAYRGAIINTDVGGTADSKLRVALPAGFTVASQGAPGFCYYRDNGGARTIGIVTAVAGQTYIEIEKIDGSNWTLTTGDNTSVVFNIVLEVA